MRFSFLSFLSSCFFFHCSPFSVFFDFCDYCEKYDRSDTESHNDVNKNEGKRKYVIQLSNLLKKRFEKPEAPAPTDAEAGIASNDEEDNAAPSESTVIIDDEPQKKVWRLFPESEHTTNDRSVDL